MNNYYMNPNNNNQRIYQHQQQGFYNGNMAMNFMPMQPPLPPPPPPLPPQPPVPPQPLMQSLSQNPPKPLIPHVSSN